MDRLADQHCFDPDLLLDFAVHVELARVQRGSTSFADGSCSWPEVSGVSEAHAAVTAPGSMVVGVSPGVPSGLHGVTSGGFASAPGKRAALAHSEIMMHQPHSRPAAWPARRATA